MINSAGGSRSSPQAKIMNTMEHADGRLLQIPDGQVFATSLPETCNTVKESNCIEGALGKAKRETKATQVDQSNQLEVTESEQPLTKRLVPYQGIVDNEQKGQIGQSSPEADKFSFQNSVETVMSTDNASDLGYDPDNVTERQMPAVISPLNIKQSELTDVPGIQSSAIGLQISSREDNKLSANRGEPRQSIDNTVQRTVLIDSIDEETSPRKIEKIPGAQKEARQNIIKAIQSSTSKTQFSRTDSQVVQKSRRLESKHQKLQNIKGKLIEGLSANEVVLQTHLRKLNVIQEKIRQAKAFRDSTKERLLLINERLEKRLENRLPDTEEQKVARKTNLINVDVDVMGSSQAIKENLPADKKLYANKDKLSSKLKTADLNETRIEVKIFKNLFSHIFK